jgi:hypothetical protein
MLDKPLYLKRLPFRVYLDRTPPEKAVYWHDPPDPSPKALERMMYLYCDLVGPIARRSELVIVGFSLISDWTTVRFGRIPHVG